MCHSPRSGWSFHSDRGHREQGHVLVGEADFGEMERAQVQVFVQRIGNHRMGGGEGNRVVLEADLIIELAIA